MSALQLVRQIGGRDILLRFSIDMTMLGLDNKKNREDNAGDGGRRKGGRKSEESEGVVGESKVPDLIEEKPGYIT